MLLENAIEFGVLVQRKSGGDFFNSLPKLKEIQCRMLEWAKRGACWLLVTGLSFGSGGVVLVDGQPSKATMQQVRGAMRYWQLRGGNVEILPSDDHIGPWCSEMLDFLRAIESVPVREVVHKGPVQALSMEDKDWVTTGSAFPSNIGRQRRQALYEALVTRKVDPTLANALYMLTSEQLESVSGWGGKTASDVRKWWGVEGIVRETPAFGAITFRWENGLPFKVSGSGVEMVEKGGGAEVTFTSYNAMEVFRDMLEVAQG
jgi:hypothetical protein